MRQTWIALLLLAPCGCAVLGGGVTREQRERWNTIARAAPAATRVSVSCTGRSTDGGSAEKKAGPSSCLTEAKRVVAGLPGVTLTEAQPIDEVWNFTVQDEFRTSETFWPSVLTLALFPYWVEHHTVLHVAKFRAGETKPYSAQGHEYSYTYLQQLLIFPVGLYQLFTYDDWSLRVLLSQPNYLESQKL